MTVNRPIIFSCVAIALFVGLGFSYFNNGDPAEKEKVLMETMLEGFKKYHFLPEEIDDGFSNKFYDLYLKRLDSGKRFLTNEEVGQLEAQKSLIDDQMNAGTTEFFSLSVDLIEKGILRAEGYLNQYIDRPFTFDGTETFELDGEKRTFASTSSDLEKRWVEILKYETMVRLDNNRDKQAEAIKEGTLEGKEKSFAELEKEAREDVKKVFSKWFKRLKKQERKERWAMFLNTMTNVHDPHSGYYAPVEKQNFDINMSGKLIGIGARLQADGEVTKIVEIITGGPAWKEGTIKAEDLIMKVAQEGEEPVDISGMLINEVVSLIRGKKGTKVHLTVKTSKGEEKIVTIIRDEVILDEGYAKSLILNYEDEGINNIGYIMLPRFYADFQDANGRQCSEDVAQEIIKLKGQGVKDIILDLRDNGGGSLRDVVKMSGLFIEKGPIVQVKARGMKPRILEDTDERVLFDGNLIIMVNQFSASASEILAAALQDYERAIVIGSKSTFGKGTVQRFVDLDAMVWGHKELKPLGSVKMTIQKFYRIDGGSTQLKGVEPDILLPDDFQHIEIGEKEYDYAMDWTSIDEIEYDQNVKGIGSIEKLRRKSSARVAASETFRLINENAKRLSESREDTEYSLNIESYSNEMDENKASAKKYESIMKDPIDGLEVINLDADKSEIQTDSSKIARNDKWLEEVTKDVYIEEALLIMKDMKSRSPLKNRGK